MINIICLKFGNGKMYTSDWVNRLYRMVEKNCPLPFQFWCITEDPKGIRPEVNLLNFPSQYDHIEKHWLKIWFFSKEFPIKGRCLYFDLDVVIQNDMSDLVNHDCYIPCVLRGKVFEFNSSAIMWDSRKDNSEIWEKFLNNAQYYVDNRETDDEYFSIEWGHYIRKLPRKWFYSRIQGPLDDDQDFQMDVLYDDVWAEDKEYFRMPQKMICNFNNVGRPEINEKLREKIWEPYEHYWE